MKVADTWLLLYHFTELKTVRDTPTQAGVQLQDQTFTHHRLHAGQDVSKSSAVGGRVERLIGPNPFHNWADEC